MSVASLYGVSVQPSLTLELETPVKNEIGFSDELKRNPNVKAVRKLNHTIWVVTCTAGTDPRTLDHIGIVARNQVPLFQ